MFFVLGHPILAMFFLLPIIVVTIVFCPLLYLATRLFIVFMSRCSNIESFFDKEPGGDDSEVSHERSENDYFSLILQALGHSIWVQLLILNPDVGFVNFFKATASLYGNLSLGFSLGSIIDSFGIPYFEFEAPEFKLVFATQAISLIYSTVTFFQFMVKAFGLLPDTDCLLPDTDKLPRTSPDTDEPPRTLGEVGVEMQSTSPEKNRSSVASIESLEMYRSRSSTLDRNRRSSTRNCEDNKERDQSDF
jgi:hypothetical protein